LDNLGIGDIAALITVGGLAIYVVGLAGLAWSIWSRITNDFSTAWYAASLIPRTVVAGQAMRIWMRWPLAITLLWVPATLVWVILAKSDIQSVLSLIISGLSPTSQRSLQVVLTTLAGAIGVALMRLLASRLIPEWDSASIWSRSLAVTSLFFGFALAITASIVASTGIAIDQVFPPELRVNGDRVLLGVAFIFAGGFLIGMPSSASVEPPLPTVRFSQPSGTDVVYGKLVAHRDGFWHYFNGMLELTSVRDDVVVGVRVGEAGIATESEATIDTD
jgi:hypothetical protein